MFSKSLLVALTLVATAADLACQTRPAQNPKDEPQFLSCPNEHSAQPTISLTLRADENLVKAGSPARVKITLTNVSNQDISLWNGPGGNYVFNVRDDSGTPSTETRRGAIRNGHIDLNTLTPRERTISGGACVTLNPGKTLSEPVNLNQLYNLDSPGKYSIQAQRRDPASGRDIRSNTIVVTLNP